MGRNSGHEIRELTFTFIALCLFILAIGCSGNVPPPAETKTPGYAITYIQTPTPRTTIEWISTPTKVLPIQVSPGIGEGITITEQEIDAHYEDLTEPLSSGLYIVYVTLEIAENGDLNYEIWSQSLENGEKKKLLDCIACLLNIWQLETYSDQRGLLKIIAVTTGFDRSADSVLVFDINRRQSRMVSCTSDDPEKYCQILLFFGKLMVFGEDYPFIDVELAPSQWIVISGEALSSQGYAPRLFPGGEIYFYPLRICGEDNSYRVTIIGNEYDVEELPTLKGICDFDPSPLFLGKSSSSTDSQVAYVVGNSTPLYRWFWFFEKIFFSSLDPDDSIVVCPSNTLFTGDGNNCSEIFENAMRVIPFGTVSSNAIGWLNDNCFLWEKPFNPWEGQKIGTLDLDGNIKILYQGSKGITYQVSPDGKWLLYRRTEAPLSFGLLSTDDGSTIYLPLPEDTVDATWLLIP